jgi:hypothetical protein
MTVSEMHSAPVSTASMASSLRRPKTRAVIPYIVAALVKQGSKNALVAAEQRFILDVIVDILEDEVGIALERCRQSENLNRK